MIFRHSIIARFVILILWYNSIKIKYLEEHKVPNLTSSIRLQEYGVGIFGSALTKSALKKALKKNYITVNGSIATSATVIHGGESICFSKPKEVKPNKVLELPLNVIFEDDFLAIIDKPAGVLVSGNSFITVANALIQNLHPSLQADATKPQPVHRLDYATTGALLIGKTSNSIRVLNKMFENKKIDKTYFAVTIGEMDVTGSVTSEIDNKPAQSNYKVTDSVSSKRFGKLNFIELKPETGRRHQLRKHLASINNPILGDKVYGLENLILKGKGLYLHAYSLSFIHPFTNRNVYFKSSLPERFNKLF